MTNVVVYRIALSNKAKEEQYLNYFNGSNDLLEVMKQFYEYLVDEKVEYNIQGKKRILSISSKIEILEEERCLVSILDYGQTGEYSEIRKGDTHKLLHSVNKTDVQVRKLFSLIHVPKNKKYGYIIFEKKANYGAKTIFEKEFNKFLKEKGFLDFRLVMTPELNYRYLSMIIKQGKIKKVTRVLREIQNLYQLELFPFPKERRIVDPLPNKQEAFALKRILYSLFFSKHNQSHKLSLGGMNDIDEILFEMLYKGSAITLYIKDKSKIRSNINVTQMLDFENGEPTYESKIRVALELIYEIQGFDIDDINQVA